MITQPPEIIKIFSATPLWCEPVVNNVGLLQGSARGNCFWEAKLPLHINPVPISL